MENYFLIEHAVNDGQSVNALFEYGTQDEALAAYYDFVAYQMKLATVSYILAQVIDESGSYLIGTHWTRAVEPVKEVEE